VDGVFRDHAAVAAALAALARPEIWSLFANGIDYLLVGVLFVGEYVFRRVRYRITSTAPSPMWFERGPRGQAPPRRSAANERSWKCTLVAYSDRGSRSATQFMKVARFALRPARRAFAALSDFAYFSLFSPRAAALRASISHSPCRMPRLTDLWRHFFTFAATVLDRVYFIDGRFGRFDIEVRGLEPSAARTLAKGRGCLLLGPPGQLRAAAHARALARIARQRRDVRGKRREYHRGVERPADRCCGERIIVSGELDTYAAVAECLSARRAGRHARRPPGRLRKDGHVPVLRA